MDNDLLLSVGNLIDSEGLGNVFQALLIACKERDMVSLAADLDEIMQQHKETADFWGLDVAAETITFVPGIDILLGD